jgi:hypothetical protein
MLSHVLRCRGRRDGPIRDAQFVEGVPSRGESFSGGRGLGYLDVVVPQADKVRCRMSRKSEAPVKAQVAGRRIQPQKATGIFGELSLGASFVVIEMVGSARRSGDDPRGTVG